MVFHIDSTYDGATIKDLLYNNINISRGFITKLKKLENGITVNGEHATVRRVLRSGDILCLMTEDSEEEQNENLVPTKMPLDIIFENDDIIAVNKPYNIATHPSIKHYDDTLANGLAYYFKSKNTPFIFRAVNRLDKDTSGIVLIAKNRICANKLSILSQKGKIKKSYIAVLDGVLPEKSGQICAPIRRREESIIFREVCNPSDKGAKPAITEYETIAQNGQASIVLAGLITGRTHQLRVHFSSMGASIIGDELYPIQNDKCSALNKGASRLALHACLLEINYDNNNKFVLSAPIPDDMKKLCDEIDTSGKLNRRL